VLFPCLPVFCGLNKSYERSEVRIERLNLENELRVENSIPVGLHEIKKSFARGEKSVKQVTVEVRITHIHTLHFSGYHFGAGLASQSIAS
jgi:hypothetical protein